MRIEKPKWMVFLMASLMVFGCRDGSQFGDEVTVSGTGSSGATTSFVAQPAPTGSFPTAKNGDVLLGNPEYKAISYGSFRTTERTEANVPTVAEIKEDLRIMQAMGIKLLRTYNTQGFSDTANLLVAIDELSQEDSSFEMYVMLGVWIEALNSWTDQTVLHDQEAPGNALEMAKAVEMVNAYPEIIKVIAVGNEAMVHWAPYHVAPAIILGHVQDLQAKKAAGEIPAEVWITSSDNWASWAGQGDYANEDLDALIEAVDYVSAHTYPFHDSHYNSGFWQVPADEQDLTSLEQAQLAMGRAAEYAVDQVVTVQAKVLSISSDKQIHIGETGWSSYTNNLYGDGGSGAADEYKQKAYYDAMREWSDTNQVSLFFFEMFDEPWKGDASNSGDSEKHFGLIDINGNAKYVLWDLVDAGAFDGLTRAGLAINKSYGGVEQTVLDGVLDIPYQALPGEVIAGNELVVLDDSSLTPVVWTGSEYLSVDSGLLTMVIPSSVTNGWGYGAGLESSAGVNLTGFENGTLEFDIRGTTGSDITIGFQTGVYDSSTRPQTNNGVTFGPSGRSITTDWQNYSIDISELVGSNSPDFTDVTSVIYFMGGTSVDGGTIEMQNIVFRK